jgi:hypothetical protein
MRGHDRRVLLRVVVRWPCRHPARRAGGHPFGGPGEVVVQAAVVGRTREGRGIVVPTQKSMWPRPEPIELRAWLAPARPTPLWTCRARRCR